MRYDHAAWAQQATEVIAALADPRAQYVLTQAEDLLAPPDIDDVHPEYVRGVVELVTRTAGLSHDDTPAVLMALGYGDKADEVREVLYGRAS